MHDTVSDTDRYVATVTPLASAPAVQDASTDRLTDRTPDPRDVCWRNTGRGPPAPSWSVDVVVQERPRGYHGGARPRDHLSRPDRHGGPGGSRGTCGQLTRAG
ncbi:hypothetical protein SSPG_01302 [Streptomyces lividans TK24]|uniref:Uncharacterized protein n=1 Tax=Streptomyces lividans 1326 TaxID=1200984 RepID=A0A7U9HED1_STRLI|nr:hypothetical protein SSPG_01302 [Streptomyces lividans TK24]EOY51430.1 hypothetical protein SLI_6724 [Streptomyces lividans 1326]